MEVVMKNKRAKVSVVFLGVALLLSPLVMLISCKQLHKTPAPPDFTNPPPENPEQGNPNPNPSNPTPATKYEVTITQPANGKIDVTPTLPAGGKVEKNSELTFTLSANTSYKVKALTIGDATYSNVTDNTITQKVKIEKETAVSAVVEAEATPTPDTGIFTDTQGNKVTIAPLEDYYGEITGYRLTGDIYIEEINSAAFKAKLDTLNGKDLYTDSLNINCFTNQNSTITAKEITPEVLTGVLTIGEEKKFSAFRLNNQTSNGPIDIKFDSTVEKSFDIKDLNKFSFSSNFKLDSNSNVIVGSKEIKQTDAGNKDITPYPKVNDLLTLLRNETLKDDIIVKDVYITGNVKDLLPKLIGPNKIKETNGGVKFLHVYEFMCPGPNVTEYDGSENNNTPTPLEELLEFRKRTNEQWNSVIEEYVRSLRLINLVLENIDTANMTEEELKLLHFKGDNVAGNIIFKNSNLSKMRYRSTTGPVDLTFDNTTLPSNMAHSKVNNLILKNVTFPKEEILKEQFAKIPYIVPNINNSLEIHGEIKDSPLEGKNTEELDELLPQKNMPENYTGSLEIYKKLKEHIYRGEARTINGNPNPNYHGSIQKRQSQLLALLQTQNKSRG
jgi:lipoprotein